MDIFTKEKRSEVMSKIRSTNTRLEVDFCKSLSREIYSKGYRYRRNYRGIPGSPDVVFVSRKIAVFLDGDFWHGRFYEKTKSKLPSEFWRLKIQTNINRDKRVTRKLRRMGWTVIRMWEGDVRKHPDKTLKRVLDKLIVM